MRRWFALAAAMLLALLVLLAWAIWQPAPDALLEAWFVDVGEADCCILRCGDQVMMVDGGNVADSQLVYAVLHDALQIDHIDIMVATHPHEDHVGGQQLRGAARSRTPKRRRHQLRPEQRVRPSLA